MPKPAKFSYEKKESFRDAFYFIIVCEGQNREPEYFRFFDGLSSRVKVVPVGNTDGNSSPMQLINNALAKEEELDADPDQDLVWFVIDTDRWKEQIRALRNECNSNSRTHWKVAQSNPCFEVWLYFHVAKAKPELAELDKCNKWKPYVHNIIKGGFNPDFHPIAIEAACVNAKENCEEDGDSPLPGSTQIWRLAEELIPLIKKDLDALKDRFPSPEAL